ncbi:MAG: MFS transporter [Myxococcota bacterium]
MGHGNAVLLGSRHGLLGLPAPPPMHRENVLRLAWPLLRQRRLALILVGIGLYYLGPGAYDTAISLHLEDLGWPSHRIGTAWSIAVVSELLMMLAAPRLVRRFGTATLWPVCALTAAGRWLLLSYLESSQWILFWQPLHGITFGLWYLCMVDQVQAHAPRTYARSFKAPPPPAWASA